MHSQIIIFTTLFCGIKLINGQLLPNAERDAMTEQKKCGEGRMKGIQVCVSYDMCDPKTKEVIAVHARTIVPLSSSFPDETECDDLLHICCTIPEKDRTTSSSSTTESTLSITKPTFKPINPKPARAELSRCGIRNPQGLDTSIVDVHNDEAQYGEFPWMVMILRTIVKGNQSPSICGGSLISPGVVLTAADCVQNYVDNVDKIKIRAGEWDILSERELYPTQDRYVSKIIIHPGFDEDTGGNDFALIFLQNIFSRAENVGTICLPLYKQVISSDNCITGGWGKRKFEANSTQSNIMKKIELTIVSNEICQNVMRRTVLGQDFVLPDTIICAEAPGYDGCKADAGGPLICPDPYNPNRYVQVGIVSWGVGCYKAPGFYADVASARHWIDGVMAEEGYTPIPYSC